MLARASRTSFETARRSAIAALGDLRVDTGRYACPSELRQSRTAGARHGWRVRFDVAEQRGAYWRCTGFHEGAAAALRNFLTGFAEQELLEVLQISNSLGDVFAHIPRDVG